MEPPYLTLEEATTIFSIIHCFIRDRANHRHKHNPELDSLPQGFCSVPWRRVYRQPEQQEGHPSMMHWEPSELSFGGAGNLWCFTGLLRCGRNIVRKTENGQTWESRNGRQRKNGYPAQILVDRLVLSSKDFDMLELTLDQTKPSVALCKIRRTQQGTNVAAGSSQDSSSVNAFNSPGPSTTSREGEGAGSQEGATGMEIDSQVNAPQGGVSCERDYLKYQEAVTILHRMMEKFEIVCWYSNEAHNISSLVQSAASILINEAHRLDINLEPGSTRSNASNSTRLMGAASGAANFSAMDNRAAPVTSMEQRMDDDFDAEWEFVDSDEANGA